MQFRQQRKYLRHILKIRRSHYFKNIKSKMPCFVLLAKCFTKLSQSDKLKIKYLLNFVIIILKKKAGMGI